MNFWRSRNFRLAYRSIRTTRSRSYITMLGIIVSVMAVVLIVCIGQGVKQQIAVQLGHYGKDVFTVQPKSTSGGYGALVGESTGVTSLLSEKDLRIVKQTQGVTSVAPLAAVTGSVSGDHTVNAPFILATSSDLPDLLHQSFASGGTFDPGDNSKTVILGEAIAQKLFNDNAPLGQGLTWRGQRFLVAGVLDDFKAPPFSLEANFNDAIFVPYATAQSLTGDVLGMYQIFARSDNPADINQVTQRVSTALITAHGGAHDVSVDQASKANLASDRTIHLLTLMIGGAALIALIVGGVGIMNVMLVSVTERMHEIGIRKAIGATNRQIMRQFVAEAFVLSAIGAVFGTVLSCAAVGLLRLYTSLQPILVWQVLVIAPVVAVAIGLLFGSFPALKAARKDPIDALRNE